MGRKAKIYDPLVASQVEAMAGIGLSIKDIALVVRLADKTVSKLYEEEFHRGKAKANAKVGTRLFKKAVEDGDTASLIFWAKTQMGWRETQRIDHTSSDGTMATKPVVSVDFGEMTPEQLTDIGMAFFRGKRGVEDGTKGQG